ncbi:Wall-associated receptor kinase-like 9 [Morus notabilis]|uniref:Wall-associated receptor kinase-like 9 n=1 Tax=Morus notabilis TaxID=981085 RepID=W9RTD0_9ROSA|nr:Wall-associated receptor kinase-like 9 [Morus notabilis]
MRNIWLLGSRIFPIKSIHRESDVYSFGVVLVELLIRQKAISQTRSEEGRNLASYFIMEMEEDVLFNISDAQVLEDAPKEEIIIVAKIAERCLNLNGRNRPTMNEVAMELEGIIQKSKRSATFEAQRNYDEDEYIRTSR